MSLLNPQLSDLNYLVMPTDSTEEALSSKRYATGDEWSQFQNLIVQLYVDENKTLDEVKQYMEERHGFLATYAWPPFPSTGHSD